MVDPAFWSRGTTLRTLERQPISPDDRDVSDHDITDLKLPVSKTKNSTSSDDGGEPDFDSTDTKIIGAPANDSDPSNSDDEAPPAFSEMTRAERDELMAAVKSLQRDQDDIKRLQQQHDQHLKDILSRQPSLPKMFQVIMRKSLTPETPLETYQTDNFSSGRSGYETQSQSSTLKNMLPYEQDEIYVHLEQVYTNLRVFQASARSIKAVLGPAKVHPSTYYNVDEIDPRKRENDELRKKIAMLELELRATKPPRLEGPTPASVTCKPQRGSNEAYSILPSKDIVIGRPTPPLPVLPAPVDIRATEVTFKWTISEYSRKFRDETIRGGKQYSSPFYLSHCGYRAHMEAYLNGNGTAANRCMSVFLRVIKGEYDRTLNWPVNLHMVVILVNQSGQNMECLKAGGHQFQFMQPQGHADSETDCWGLIEFVSHELIRRKDYISGDKIVIKCRLMILPS